ncbi:hypothetical protein GCM10010246_55970 [Streptomyces cuspidosporus]|uniref:Uncharacterized protein n=1 Tax=Streptomyces cuspidosporus TaxID=66882 RepID=A0ABN3GRZ0_9ACTN
MSLALVARWLFQAFGGHVREGAVELEGVLHGGGFGVAGDSEVGQAPAATEQQDVLRLEVAVDDLAVFEVGECFSDVEQDGDRLVEWQLVVLLDVVAQRLLGTGHHQYPLAFVLAAVDDRHHVADAVQINEEHLALGARRFGYELHRRPLAGGVLRLEHGAEATTPDAGADGPLLVQCQSHVRLVSIVNCCPVRVVSPRFYPPRDH